MKNRYQQLIGVISWLIKLGRIYILVELSCLYKHLCSPGEVNLDSVYHIFSQLQKNIGKNPGRVTYNLMYKLKYDIVFEVYGIYLDEWNCFYHDGQEIIPRHMSEALGEYVVIKSYVDDNYAGNMEI